MPVIYSKVLEEDVVRSMSDRELLNAIYSLLSNIYSTISEEPVLKPSSYSMKTSPNPNTAEPVLPNETITQNFVIQNNGASGSGSLQIGGMDEPALSIAPGAMLIYSLIGFSTDLSKWYQRCSTASQPYVVMVLNP